MALDELPYRAEEISADIGFDGGAQNLPKAIKRQKPKDTGMMGVAFCRHCIMFSH